MMFGQCLLKTQNIPANRTEQSTNVVLYKKKLSVNFTVHAKLKFNFYYLALEYKFIKITILYINSLLSDKKEAKLMAS